MTGPRFFPRKFRFFLDELLWGDDAKGCEKASELWASFGDLDQECVMRCAGNLSIRPSVMSLLALTGLALLSIAAAPAAAAENDRSRPSEVDRALLAARLEAGEYGPAVDAARSIDDLTQRVGYLKQIVAVQRDAGEFQAAEATARRIPVPE